MLNLDHLLIIIDMIKIICYLSITKGTKIIVSYFSFISVEPSVRRGAFNFTGLYILKQAVQLHFTRKGGIYCGALMAGLFYRAHYESICQLVGY